MHRLSCILSKKKKKKYVMELLVQIQHGCFLIMLMDGKGMTLCTFVVIF